MSKMDTVFGYGSMPELDQVPTVSERELSDFSAELRAREMTYLAEHPEELMNVVIRIRERGGVVRWPNRV